ARTVPASELSSGYRRIRDDNELMRSRFLQRGLAEEEIAVQPVTSYPVHGPQGEINSYRMVQPMQVISENLDEVEQLALEPGSFLSGELFLERSQLEYFYSEIDTLKHELLGKATADARSRAKEIAEPAGVTVGPIRQARAGVFQIREPFSTEVSGYGMYNTSSRQKEISVTVHATFLVR
ncbi:MAG: SIMPL domain-containing protein, partial [Spirochaetaceae bacterium]